MIIKSNKCKCFFCGHKLTEKAEGFRKLQKNGVEWDEHNNYVENPTLEGKFKMFLHPSCAVMLATRLLGDAFDADKSVDDPGLVMDLIQTRIKYEPKVKHVYKIHKGKTNGR